MNNRPIDKTKKSNIKCEHCKWWAFGGIKAPTMMCFKHTCPKEYYQRCKEFEWEEGK